ncbi:cell wall protein DAN4-like [Harmonia axyridis]|uniref:cell wall protein DAN4-like n=1 Tax=Harmonia axyridis TaxID=115357 RepID=UPI001E278582|nr:cell wall protein DAN4-like [Harmonia axyridis]
MDLWYKVVLYFIALFGSGQFVVHKGLVPRENGNLSDSSSVYSDYDDSPKDFGSKSCILSKLPTLSSKFVIFPRDYFQRKKTTKLPTEVSTKRTKLRKKTTRRHVPTSVSTENIQINKHNVTHPTHIPKIRPIILKKKHAVNSTKFHLNKVPRSLLTNFTKTRRTKTPTNTPSIQEIPLVTIPSTESMISDQNWSPTKETTVAYTQIVITTPPETTVYGNLITSSVDALDDKNFEFSSQPYDDQDDTKLLLSSRRDHYSTKDISDTWYPYNSTSLPSISTECHIITTDNDISSVSSTISSTSYHSSSYFTTSTTSTTPTTSITTETTKFSALTSSPTPGISSTASTPKKRNSKLIRSSLLPLVMIGNKFYHLQTDIKVNFFGAFHFCKKYGMELLSIENRKEEVAIANFLNESRIGEIWTSGTDLAKEGKFIWLSTGKPFDYTAWGPNQPDNFGSIEDCVQIIMRPLFSDYFAWEDVFCDLPSSFICEVSTCTDFCMND